MLEQPRFHLLPAAGEGNLSSHHVLMFHAHAYSHYGGQALGNGSPAPQLLFVSPMGYIAPEPYARTRVHVHTPGIGTDIESVILVIAPRAACRSICKLVPMGLSFLDLTLLSYRVAL